jgi:uronate dehydrogenase
MIDGEPVQDRAAMRVLLTGATGSVGALLRPWLRRDYAAVVLNSRSPITDLATNERWIGGDICDPSLWDRLLPDVDAVVHLAGVVGSHYTFEQTCTPNFIATYHLFEAVRRHGLRRVVYASTHHAVGYLERTAPVDHNTSPRPDSWYGLTKACGELVAVHAADRYRLDVMSIRIGYVAETVPDERRLHTWCSARDLASLIRLGLTGPQSGHHLVYAASDCPAPLFDNAHAIALGWRPQDRALDHLVDPAIAAQRPDPRLPHQRYIGGHFAVREDETIGPGEAT